MSDGEGAIWIVAANIALLSFLAIGGGIITILPEIHRLVVEVHGWMDGRTFTELFAMAQAAPGPNLLVVTLIGFYVAGIPGAVLCTLAISVPTSVLAYVATQIWYRFRAARWRLILQAGVVPVTVGLLSASAYLIARQVDTSLTAVAVTAVSALLLTFTRIHPLLVMAAGGALGLAGLI